MVSITQLGAPSSSSSTDSNSCTYDVFMSFRGEDTRSNFTDHVYSALRQKGLLTFVDDEPRRGEELSPAHFEAIQGSRVSVIVFSENYASSKWCLDELVQILQCKESKQQLVFPVFYKVVPSDVRNHTGKFGEALADHERKFENDLEKVLRWRTALTEAGNLSGWCLLDRPESEFIHEIVEEILAQVIKRNYLPVARYAVGLDSRVQDMLEILDLGESELRMVGVCGMGRVGKTTISKAVFRSMAHKFEGSCFSTNVREASMPQRGLGEGLKSLQNLKSLNLGGCKSLTNIPDLSGIPSLECLDLSGCTSLGEIHPSVGFHKKLVDLNLGGCKSLTNIPDLSGIPSLECLDLTSLSLSNILAINELLSSIRHLYNLEQLSLECCGNLTNLPLSIYTLQKLRTVSLSRNPKLLTFPNKVDSEVLPADSKVSDDSLSQRQRHDEGCCLLEPDSEFNLALPWLHEFIAEGCSFSDTDDIKKSRLNLINKNLGSWKSLTEVPNFSRIVLNSESLNLKNCTSLVELHPYVGFLDKLTMLEEIQNFKNLQDASLRNCKRRSKRLEPSVPSLKNLTSINFESCQFLTKIPDISGLPNVMDLNLKDCANLKEVHCSVGFLEKLVSLNLGGCYNLVTFPRRIALKSVKHISLRGCRRLETSLEIIHKMECLTLLDLSGTAIKELPSSLEFLVSLEELIVRECVNLMNLPRSIYGLQHLWCLDLQNCSKLVTFPKWSSESFPTDSNISLDLWYINLCGCKRLQEIPELPPKVEWVNAADCIQLERFAKLSNIMKHTESEMIKCISLFNCQILCGSLVCDMAEIENILLNEVTLCSLFLYCKQSEFDIVFPGTEVPKWFSHRNDLVELINKCEFSFEIPANFNLGNKGLAICAAAAVEKFDPKEKEIVQQSNFGKCSFTARIDINAERIFTRSFYFEEKDMELAHVWLCFVPLVKFAYRQSPPFTCGVSLEHTSQGSVRCTSYGVHFVIPQDEDEDEDEDGDGDEGEDDGDEDGDDLEDDNTEN